MVDGLLALLSSISIEVVIKSFRASFAVCFVGRLAIFLTGWILTSLVVLMVVWLAGCVLHWSAACLSGWVVAWLVGLLVPWS